MRCYRRLLNISYKDHVTNEKVRNRIQNVIGVHDNLLHVTNEEIHNRIQHAIGVHDNLLTMVNKRKLRWYGHISRSLAWRRQFCRGQWKEQEGEEDRRRDGKITSRNGWEWGLDIPWGQRKTGKTGKILLQRHLWCSDYLQGKGTEMRWACTRITLLISYKLVNITKYGMGWKQVRANEKPFIYKLYNKDYFCINLYLESGVHLTDIFCLLVAQMILYGSVKHQFIVTNIILIIQKRQIVVNKTVLSIILNKMT